jgi:CheY-like chemotaxis protein
MKAIFSERALGGIDNYSGMDLIKDFMSPLQGIKAKESLDSHIQTLSKTFYILIVDDCAFDIELLSIEIKKIVQCEIISCGSGRVALELVEAIKFWVLFLDLKLGGEMSGIEFLKALKPEHRPPIVIVTGSTMGSPEVDEALRLGVVMVIVKPVRGEQLKTVFSTL